MIRGPQKLFRIEATVREASRRTPESLWISVVGIEHEPFVVVGIGLVVVGRPDVVWAKAPKRFLRRRGWEVSKRKPLNVCFPLEALSPGAAEAIEGPIETNPRPAIGVESAIISLSTGVEMRQRLRDIVREPPPKRWFHPS